MATRRRKALRRRKNGLSPEAKARLARLQEATVAALKAAGRGAAAVGRAAWEGGKRAAPHVGRAVRGTAKVTARLGGGAMRAVGSEVESWGRKANPPGAVADRSALQGIVAQIENIGVTEEDSAAGVDIDSQDALDTLFYVDKVVRKRLGLFNDRNVYVEGLMQIEDVLVDIVDDDEDAQISAADAISALAEIRYIARHTLASAGKKGAPPSRIIKRPQPPRRKKTVTRKRIVPR